MRTRKTSILILAALLATGCAQLPQQSRVSAADVDARPFALEARGPGSVFASVDEAAIDALTYCYLQAKESGDLNRMRAGTIERSGSGFTYHEVHVANPMTQRRIKYVLAPRDVARFHVYPPHRDRDINRANERLSTTDWRSVSVIDPLHRSLYVLHPSLEIRAYSGADGESVDVARLRAPARDWEWPSLFARR